MADTTWIQDQENLSPVALTVRAQALPLDDDGRLLWDSFFPPQDTDSIRISEITTLDFRPAADRREWNQRGRLIAPKTPDLRDYEMVPIEAWFGIDEYEMQKLVERGLQPNTELFKDVMGARVEDRVFGQGDLRNGSIVMACWRRLEVESFQAWANGTIVARDPQSGTTQSFSFGFAGARYETAGTAWDNGGVNAYDELILFLQRAEDLVGAIEGVMMRRATYLEIQKDAPNPMPGALAAVKPTQKQIEDMVAAEFGMGAFTIYINERSLDVYTDGGLDVTRTKLWPAQKVAIVPAGEAVGTTYKAPVARAAELRSQAPGAGIDIRGVTVYHETANGGRDLTIEAQLNAFPIPDEQRVHVIDAGV